MAREERQRNRKRTIFRETEKQLGPEHSRDQAWPGMGPWAPTLWLQSGPFERLNPGSALGLQARTVSQHP